VKVTSSDLLAILRRFNIANDEHVPRHIDQIVHHHPSAINQLVHFRFERSHYDALFDDTAEDDTSYIVQQIQTVRPNMSGEVLRNPTSDLDTYGLPFKGKDVYLFKEMSGKMRLDVLLAEHHPETSRSTWQKHIKAGHISVNDTPATHPRQEVSDADSIAINVPEALDFSEKSLPILYLDDDVIVVDKPAGVLTHSKGELNDEFTVAEFFRRYTTVGLDTNRPGIVHRLDRDTSGVIIGARTPEASHLLKAQFSERRAKKWYLAIVKGQPKLDKARIDLPIERNPSAPGTFRVDSKGKAAITEYKVVSTWGVYALLALHPLTGRTHQLRVHMQYLQTPIVGDRVYGKAGDRLFLHAYRLEITTGGGKRQTFTAPIPTEFHERAGTIDEASLCD
jgi:23S rRNA pseudouridine1911/1915/1917 synthase